jgi:hypothetical protein
MLLVLTLAWPEWIEEAFGVDPDGGSGALEWALVIVFAICASTTSVLARRDWASRRDGAVADPSRAE